jgi:hypothetical protein
MWIFFLLKMWQCSTLCICSLDANKQVTPSKQNAVVTKKSPAQLKQTPVAAVAGKKRQLETEDDDDEDDSEDENESDEIEKGCIKID